MKQKLKRAIIHGYYQFLRLFMRKKWQRKYIDYMERFRFSKRYKELHDQIFCCIREDRPDIFYSPLRRKYISFCILVLGIVRGEDPAFFWGRDYPGSSLRQRRAAVTRCRLLFGNSIFNNPNKTAYLKDKILFSHHWEAFFSRSSCCPQEVTEEEFCRVFHGIERLAVKPREGSLGTGFRVVDVHNNLEEIYRDLVNQPQLIVEEFVFQTGLLHELNPTSLNTVRFATLRMKNRIIPIYALLRLGGANRLTDNFHTNGVLVTIRMADGLILDGMTATRNRLSCHPTTGMQFSGKTIPRWNEVVDFCIRAHEIAPEGLDLIGWDVCVDETHLLMIEGNGCPGFSAYRRGNPDGWKLFKQYLNAKERDGLL